MTRLVATSWDDGLESDKRLLDILFNQNIRSSFAITPARHENLPVPNDVRSKRYGQLMRLNDMHLYRGHDICNHTANHHEMKLSDKKWQHEIFEGKVRLESMYLKPILGMVWPYGVSEVTHCRYAAKLGHTYGRTTPAPHRPWALKSYSRWNIVPVHWKTPIEKILESEHTHLALCGHTYEMRKESDWSYVTELYQALNSDPGCKLVTLTELASSIDERRSP